MFHGDIHQTQPKQTENVSKSFILTLSGNIVIWSVVALRREQKKKEREKNMSHFTFTSLLPVKKTSCGEAQENFDI